MSLGRHKDEDSIGKKGSGSLVCRVQVDGSVRRFESNSSARLAPGSAIRVTIGSGGRGFAKGRKVARLLAYVDPLTGRLIVRMGMWDVTRSTKGAEDGPQVVFESDLPVCKVDNSDD